MPLASCCASVARPCVAWEPQDDSIQWWRAGRGPFIGDVCTIGPDCVGVVFETNSTRNSRRRAWKLAHIRPQIRSRQSQGMNSGVVRRRPHSEPEFAWATELLMRRPLFQLFLIFVQITHNSCRVCVCVCVRLCVVCVTWFIFARKVRHRTLSVTPSSADFAIQNGRPCRGCHRITWWKVPNQTVPNQTEPTSITYPKFGPASHGHKSNSTLGAGAPWAWRSSSQPSVLFAWFQCSLLYRQSSICLMLIVVVVVVGTLAKELSIISPLPRFSMKCGLLWFVLPTSWLFVRGSRVGCLYFPVCPHLCLVCKC